KNALDESVSNISFCHNHLIEWSKGAGLIPNESKCKAVAIKKKGGCIVPIVPAVVTKNNIRNTFIQGVFKNRKAQCSVGCIFHTREQ
ncbi:MAG: hypothetical protein AAGK05_19850, partial [Pseudomonadota bacterium]